MELRENPNNYIDEEVSNQAATKSDSRNRHGSAGQLEQLGKQVWAASRTPLYLSMRYLAVALDSLPPVMDLSTATYGTDAMSVRFNPSTVLRLYMEDPKRLNRAYLHMLMHCLFRHMFKPIPKVEEQNTKRQKALDKAVASGFISPMEKAEWELDLQKDLWNLSCEIAVEALIDQMDSPAVARVGSEIREETYQTLKANLKVLTAEKIYEYFLTDGLLDAHRYELLVKEFSGDDHSFWERMQPQEEETNGPAAATGTQGVQGNTPGAQPESTQNPDEGQGQNQTEASQDHDDTSEDQERSGEPGNKQPQEKDSGDDNQPQNPDDKRQSELTDSPANNSTPLGQTELEDEKWKERAKRIRSELESRGKEAGEDQGSLAWTLGIELKKKRDYRDFLNRFKVYREENRIDPDSFDYGYYTYGMEVYGNMPLIEENEYTESNKIQELVIVIDTSASCKASLVQHFLNETASILLSGEDYFQKVQIHLILCDDQVQEDILITDVDKMKEFADNFTLKGGYGTDFRPAFAYIEELQAQEHLQHLKGLLYFTDGFGTYPTKPTTYDTAFVFWGDEECSDEEVPDWAIKLYVTE